MSTALRYQEPYRLSAGMLALLVHVIFFSMLYFGFRWQPRPPEEFMVEMWDTLPTPEAQAEPAPPPPPAPEAVPSPPPKAAAPVSPPAKADIELREKKKKKAEQKQVPAKKDVAKEKAAARAKREKEKRELDAYVAQRVQAEQARVRAEVDAATRVQVERYQDMIRSKIRRKMRPLDVPETAEAEFKVTVLPDGTVMDVVLLKSSGYKFYDDAAERAIHLAEPLPLPADAVLQKMFRELRLTIRP